MPHRRTFLKSLAGAGLLTAASAARVHGANDRVRIGLVGIGLIGRRHLLDFQAQPDCDIAAVCDVYEPRLDDAAALAGPSAARTTDFRRLLDRPDIDAIVVSTPDHWHALMTILACAAGKDVYVEKPLTHAAAEGDWMIAAERRYRRVVEVGTQQRSGRHFKRAVDLVRAGHIGEVRGARIDATRNILPGFTKPIGDRPLDEAAWQLWLGPAPYVPFDPARCLYHFRWFRDYSGGQTTNLLSHEIDIVQWATSQTPKRAAAFAARRSLGGFGDTPDTMDAIIEYDGFSASWSSREVAAGGAERTALFGTRGTLTFDRRGMEVVPDPERSPEDQIPSFAGPRNAAPSPARFRTTAVKDEGYEQIRDQFQPHVRNFLDAVKSRQRPVSDLESSHQTALACHLVNIAARVGRVVTWDPVRREIIGDAEATALLTKTYRAPWDRELRAALPGA